MVKPWLYRSRFSSLTSKAKTLALTAAAALAVAVSGTPAQAQTQVFADEFNTGPVNQALWRVYEPSFYLQRTQWGLAPTYGADTDGTKYARIPIQSYTPDPANTGKMFRGCQLFSHDKWNLGTGVEYETRIRSNNLPKGLILGFFSYGDTGEWTSTYQKTEIDYELLTTQGNNKAWLNIWDDWNPERGGPNLSSITTTPVNWNNNSWNTFLIRWLPGKTEWLINGVVIRTEITIQPGSPQGVCLNLWAADSGWKDAYSTAIAPATTAGTSKTWSFDVDYVRVRSLPAPPTTPMTNGLNVIYYNNETLNGTSISRVDPNINFDWGPGSPDSRIANETFSARWTGQIQAPTTGTYTFTARTDDGVRLWVNNRLLVDNWYDQSPTEKSGTINLTAGQKYAIKMEYFDNTGDAIAQLYWAGPGIAKQIVSQNRLFFSGAAPASARYGNGTGLTANYYDNADFTGTRKIRLDPRVNFDWGNYAPIPGFGTDTYSIRWTGYVQAQYTGLHTFTTRSDDGVRLYVNGQKLVDSWKAQAVFERSGTINLTAGQKYPITMEYYDNTSTSVVQLYWSNPNTAKQLVPQSQLYPQNLPLMPVFSLASGTYTSNQVVRIASSTSNAIIRYTLDGTEPTETSPALNNGGTLSVKYPTLLRARTQVAGWVLSPIRTAYYNVIDSISPTATIAAPASGNPLVSTLPAFNGTAADNANGSGLSRVNIVLKRLSDNKRWSGTAWVDTEYGLRCTLTGNRWVPSDPMPSGANLVDGSYSVKAVAFDFAGNAGVAEAPFRLQRGASGVAISAPSNNSTVTALSYVTGTHTNASRIELVVRRVADNRYWNGSAWTTQASSIPTARSTTTFRVTSGLPSGSNLISGLYEIQAVAYDSSGVSTTAKIQVMVRVVATKSSATTF